MHNFSDDLSLVKAPRALRGVFTIDLGITWLFVDTRTAEWSGQSGAGSIILHLYLWVAMARSGMDLYVVLTPFFLSTVLRPKLKMSLPLLQKIYIGNLPALYETTI